MSATLIGDATLQRRLTSLTKQMPRRDVDAAFAGGDVIRAEAARLAPRRSGNLAQNIEVEVTSNDREGASVDIGFSKRASYGRYVELGTRFAAAQPFLRPAFDTKQSEAIKAVGTELKRGIDAARRA